MKSLLPIALLLMSFGSQAWAQGGVPPTAQQLPVVKPDTDGKVWGALVFASNVAPKGTSKEQPPANLADLPQRLGKIFPYQHYEILGQHLQDVFREYESWVVPSRDLFLKVDSKGPAPGGGINLHLQFWRDQQVLVKTDAVLRTGSPLFIGGPKWREGQLIFVLILQ